MVRDIKKKPQPTSKLRNMLNYKTNVLIYKINSLKQNYKTQLKRKQTPMQNEQVKLKLTLDGVGAHGWLRFVPLSITRETEMIKKLYYSLIQCLTVLIFYMLLTTMICSLLVFLCRYIKDFSNFRR